MEVGLGRGRGRPRCRFGPLVVFALPLGVGALEVFDGVVVEVPESCGYFVD